MTFIENVIISLLLGITLTVIVSSELKKAGENRLVSLEKREIKR